MPTITQTKSAQKGHEFWRASLASTASYFKDILTKGQSSNDETVVYQTMMKLVSHLCKIVLVMMQGNQEDLCQGETKTFTKTDNFSLLLFYVQNIV